MSPLEQVRHLTRRLSPTERAELFAWLALQLVASAEQAPEAEAWDDLDCLCDELAGLGPAATDSAALLTTMRR